MGRIRWRNLVVPLVVGLAVPPIAGAATFPVTTDADRRDTVLDGVCEATAGIGDCTLRAAIAEANATPTPDVIQLAGVRYTLTIPGAGEDAGATGDLDVTGPLTIQGAGRSNTVLSGQGLGDRVLDVAGRAFLHLNDVGVRDGRAADGGDVRVRKGGRLTMLRGDVLFGDAKTGGGISVGGSATLQRTTVMHNAASRGGGIANTGSLNLDGVEIAENTATQGGGLHTGGAALIRASAIARNSATAGGGMLQAKGTTATIAKVRVSGLEVQRTTIAHNASRTSAAVVARAGDVALSDVTIARNTRATGGTGGIEASGPFRARNSLFAINAGVNCDPKAASLGGNLSDDKSCVTPNAALSDRVAKTQLGELVRSVGPTPAMELPPGSPAVNAGLGCQARDQRGFPRPAGPGCDTGAYEIHPPDFTASAGDDVNMNPGDGTCATAAGACTLRAAVQEANALAGPQAVRLRGRAFTLTIAGANEDGAATGDLDVTEDLVIEPPTGAAATLDGAGLGDRLFDVYPGGAGDVELALTRLDLRNASGPGIGGAVRVGAVLAPPSYVLVRSATLEGNTAVLQPAFGAPVSIGGAVNATSGDVGLIDARLTRNRAVSFGGALSVDGHALLRRVAIAGNQVVGLPAAVDAGGGGVFAGTNALVDADQAVVADNVAGSFAGGLVASGAGVFARGALFARGLRLERNVASVNGGGIDLVEGRLDLDASRIVDNTAEVRSGGLHMVLGARARVRRSVVARNAGGILGAGGVGGVGVLTATDSTFSGDTSLGSGPSEIAVAATLTHVTIVSARPVAVIGGPSVSFGNSIVNAGAGAWPRRSPMRGGNMDAGASCGFAGPADVSAALPALGPLMDNGGDTLTHALPAGSPAVASALPALCTPDDQRGAPRPATCDRGAFEAP